MRDGDLLRLYVDEGSEAAFTELGSRYARLVYTTCLRETADHVLAEDATQGVFLLLSRKARELRRAETIAGWLYVASRHIARNLRKQEHRRQMNEARALSAIAPQPPAHNLLWEEIDPHFHAALNRLKPADRDAILLRFVQQQNLAEVGACLGVSENTARMRVNRALEKIRAHLAKAGIAVSVAVLATLYEEHPAQAIPDSVYRSLTQIATEAGARPPATPLSSAARQAEMLLSLGAARRPFAALLGLFVLICGFTIYRRNLPDRLSLTEQRRLFQALAGTWSGALEFADDRTGKRYTYPTTVVFSSPNQADSLQFAATYQGATNVDITTIIGNAQPGQVTVKNGGPQNSHRLSGAGDLVHLNASSYAFVGFSAAANRDVRLKFALKGQQLTIQEEYRLPSSSDYRFRNRFTLSRR
jgi:RNA polymerase sigma factor (sigma-70 family)